MTFFPIPFGHAEWRIDGSGRRPSHVAEAPKASPLSRVLRRPAPRETPLVRRRTPRYLHDGYAVGGGECG